MNTFTHVRSKVARAGAGTIGVFSVMGVLAWFGLCAKGPIYADPCAGERVIGVKSELVALCDGSAIAPQGPYIVDLAPGALWA